MFKEIIIATTLLLATNHLKSQTALKEKPIYAYVSSYSRLAQTDPFGLKVFLLSPKDGSLSLLQQVTSINASWMELAPDGRFLYVCYSLRDKEGKPTGALEAYKIDAATGKLTLLNRVTLNSGPAQFAVAPDGKHLILANYFFGDYAVFAIDKDGSIAKMVSQIKNQGKGITSRQDAPHPHAVVFAPDGQFIGAADLGIDKLETFELENGTLKAVSAIDVVSGMGPRHIVFSKSGKTLYVIGELDGKISAFAYDAQSGKIGIRLQTISTTPDDYKASQSGAEISVHPSGKFLYASNRGSKTIAAYGIDTSTEKLSVLNFVSEGISNPTNFAIEPKGEYLYVPNNGGEDIIQFCIDTNNGELRSTDKKTPMTAPNIMVFRHPD